MDQRPLIKVVVIGPESTGKSTLCKLLAQHYNSRWCPEFARDYLLAHGMNYTYEDLLEIAKGQVALEDKYIQLAVGSGQSGVNSTQDSELRTPNSELRTQPSLLIIDTDMYVMKVWCEFVFGKCHEWILDQIKKRKYDLYLLCNTGLPWVKDELREYPDLATRDRLYKIYKDTMMNQSTPWVDISGNYGERLQKSIKAIDQLIAG